MADIGTVKLAVPASVRRGSVARVRALVIHPQERVERQGGRSVDRNYRFVNRIVVTYPGREIAGIEPSTAVRENPTFTVAFRATHTGPAQGTFPAPHRPQVQGTGEAQGT